MVTIDINSTKIVEVLENQVFRETPPKVFIYESVERQLAKRLDGEQPCILSSIYRRSAEAIRTQFVRLGKFDRDATNVERPKNWNDVKLGFVLNYLWNDLLRSFLNEERTDARKMELARAAPFSSSNRQELLIYKDDLIKAPSWRKLGNQEMDCRIEQLRQQVEANGQTRFVMIVAPDKLTAYANFIDNSEIDDISVLGGLSERNEDVIPRIDTAPLAAINRGEQDVYLPDDTHWGASGHRIVAETLLDFIQSKE